MIKFKKQAYKRALRDKAVAGLVNNEQGAFTSAKDTARDQHQLAGYKVGTYTRRRKRNG